MDVFRWLLTCLKKAGFIAEKSFELGLAKGVQFPQEVENREFERKKNPLPWASIRYVHCQVRTHPALN